MKTLYLSIIAILGVSTLFVTGQAYAPCIEGPGINCNNYPPPSLSQIKFDKLNYETSDKPLVTIIGAPDAVAHLEIDDLSSNIMYEHDINLAPNGTVIYALDISYYKPGVYSVIATSPISKLTTGFTVDLMPTGGHMFLNVDKSSYLPEDPVIILGTMNSNTLVHLSLIDPNGIPVESTQTFSDKTGHFSFSNFTIPANAISGMWKIGATRGLEHAQIPITVNSTLNNNSNIEMNAVTPSPLKQFKSGIAANDVKCKQDLYLVIKTKDNSPACVKLDTAYMLIKKGWAGSESAYPGGDRQFAPDTNSTIIPAHLPRSSGVRVPYSESSRVINYSGFDGVYNVTLMFHGTPQDYVLKPGTTGTITFKIEARASELSGQQYPEPLPKSLNLTNYAVFYHEITSPTILSKYPGVTMDDEGHFRACFTRPASGGTCIGGPYDVKGQVEAYVVDHPGVNVLFEPPSEVLPLGTNMVSQIVTMTITADSDAPQGTYLVEVPSFGEFLLTVGNQPYHE